MKKRALALLLTVACIHSLAAATYTISFGNYAYSPNQLSVKVGDTIVWAGDFSMHPLSSTSVPQSAATWHVTSGSSFSYVVHVAGQYNYQCDIHFSIGMVGSFTATGAGTISREMKPFSGNIDRGIVYFPSLRAIVVGTGALASDLITFTLYDAQGRLIIAMAAGAGSPAAARMVDVSALQSGLYFAKLEEGGRSVVKAVGIVR
jgi:plastocyanin